jgi:fructokinase
VKVFGGIEGGGTKFICGVGTGPRDLTFIEIPTSTPDATLREVIAYFRGQPALEAIGIGSFGPVDLDSKSPTYGFITSTPKPGWRNCDLAGEVGRAFSVPVGFDTDVNAAALAEEEWGAARGLSDFLYVTVGTGIGAGAVVCGELLHGLTHPEMGHVLIPHDRTRDPFPGLCPYHRDCLEGLASGPSIEARWGAKGIDLPPEHPAWDLEAHYLALGLVNWICTLSPRRVVMGGGVMQQKHVFPAIRRELVGLLNGYIQHAALDPSNSEFIVPATAGGQAGVLGALLLANHAAQRRSRTHRVIKS